VCVNAVLTWRTWGRHPKQQARHWGPSPPVNLRGKAWDPVDKFTKKNQHQKTTNTAKTRHGKNKAKVHYAGLLPSSTSRPPCFRIKCQDQGARGGAGALAPQLPCATRKFPFLGRHFSPVSESRFLRRSKFCAEYLSQRRKRCKGLGKHRLLKNQRDNALRNRTVIDVRFHIEERCPISKKWEK